MAKRTVNYPHTIGFRLSDKAWLSIEQQVINTDLTPHDWCRMVVLDRLHREYSFTKNERVIFHQILRTQFLVSRGFQMLADDTLRPAEWKKVRTYAKENIDFVAEHAPSDFRATSDRNGRQ
jgi:hypothetical protein